VGHDLGIFIPILGILCGLVAIIGGVFVKPWLRLKQRQLELQGRETAEKAAQYAAHTERLEQRVRVLERIVTDKGIAVADEIDRLRDEPLN
jgi:ABC-type phosphate transport system auxiliary subunit